MKIYKKKLYSLFSHYSNRLYDLEQLEKNCTVFVYAYTNILMEKKRRDYWFNNLFLLFVYTVLCFLNEPIYNNYISTKSLIDAYYEKLCVSDEKINKYCMRLRRNMFRWDIYVRKWDERYRWVERERETDKDGSKIKIRSLQNK